MLASSGPLSPEMKALEHAYEAYRKVLWVHLLHSQNLGVLRGPVSRQCTHTLASASR